MVAHLPPDWTSSPPDTKKRPKQFVVVATAGPDGVIFPNTSPIRAPAPAPLIRKHSGLSLVLLNGSDNAKKVPAASPLTTMRPSIVSFDDMADLDLRISWRTFVVPAARFPAILFSRMLGKLPIHAEFNSHQR
jgi:hypothetical protein